MTDNHTATDTATPTAVVARTSADPAAETGTNPAADTSPPAEGQTQGQPSPHARNERGGRGGRNRRNQRPQQGQQNPAGQPGNETAGNRAPRPQQAREVHPVLQKLFELYPGMFGARFLPLKLGVFQDLLALHPDAFRKDDLKVALGLHARSTRYLESVAAGHHRHDLNGVAIEPVSPEHVHHAILEIYRRRQSRSREDLRPRLFGQIIEAIEASGLPRQEYADRVRTQDDNLNEVLDAAVAELAQRAARREALLRTFEASGKTVAEYADMYGLNPAEAEQTLERARMDRIAAAAHAAAVAASAEEATAQAGLPKASDATDATDTTDTTDTTAAESSPQAEASEAGDGASRQ